MIVAPLIQASNQGRAMLAGYLVFSLLYLGSAWTGFFVPQILQPSAVDLAIPLLEWSVWIYLTQFLLLPAAIMLAADDIDRSRTFYAMLLATFIAALVFLIWPTQIERLVQPNGDATGAAWKILYLTDTPRNCFPSLHVALAGLAGIALWRRKFRVIGFVWPTLIVLSTLTTKQHVAWDAAGGLVLAALAWACLPQLIDYERTKPTYHAANH